VIGEWVEAPGYALFDAFFKQYPDAHILAEDLGELREEVYELRDHYHFKGMYVYMFHHNDKFDFDKVIVYTGTHDNDTLVSWYDQLTKAQKKKLDTTLEDYKERLAYRKIIHYCLDLPAETVIIPIWDLLGLPGSCRFNTPGTIGEPNWMWRLTNYQEFVKALDFYNRVINESKRA
ncbi:MAG: 4-alpha-glucanotransferase, partial [bacterium]